VSICCGKAIIAGGRSFGEYGVFVADAAKIPGRLVEDGRGFKAAPDAD
jgi:hypothetical protein